MTHSIDRLSTHVHHMAERRSRTKRIALVIGAVVLGLALGVASAKAQSAPPTFRQVTSISVVVAR